MREELTAEPAVAVARCEPPGPAPSTAPAASLQTPTAVLSLQRQIGNAALNRLLQADARRVLARDEKSPAAPFTNPDLQTIYDANKPCGDQQYSALKGLDEERTGVWSQITWKQVAKSAGLRIFNPNIMAQGDLGTCAAATILNFIGTSNPVRYVNLVISIYTEGKDFNGSSVNSTLRGKSPLTGTDPVDWMMMSAIQDIQNDWWQFYGQKEGEDSKREGMNSSEQRSAWKRFAGVSEARTIDTPKHDDVLPATRKVNSLVTQPGVSISMHVSASVLENAASVENKRNHVIRLLKPVQLTENADDSKSVAEFDAFTWGQTFHWKGTVNQFIHMIWAYSIFSMREGVVGG